MKTAVDKVNKGKGRIVNARFAVMCAHYLFDADFCNVASGWEKGVVEKNVQDSRRRIWIEAQNRQFASFADLNAWLGQRCRSLWGELRHPEYPALSVADMLEQEQSQMMPLPTPFDGYVEKPARVSSTCLVTVHRNRYSVPCELAGQMVSSRLYPTRISVVAGDVIVASHERVAERGQVRYDWEHYIPLVQRKPGALRNGAPFAEHARTSDAVETRPDAPCWWRQGDGTGTRRRAHSGAVSRAGGRRAGRRIRRAERRTRRECTGASQCQSSAGIRRNKLATEGGAGRQHRSVRQLARYRRSRA
jgi:hypothetical protein